MVITDQKFTSAHLATGEEFVAYERVPLSKLDFYDDDDYSQYYDCEIRMIQQRRSWMVMKAVQQIGYSRFMIFKKQWTVRQIRLQIYEMLRPLIENKPMISKKNKTEK